MFRKPKRTCAKSIRTGFAHDDQRPITRRNENGSTWEETMTPIKTIPAPLALALSLTGAAHGQTPEKKQLTLGVGGKTALYYLPLTICERLRSFQEEGTRDPTPPSPR